MRVGWQDPSCLGKYGFLYRTIREEFWYFLVFGFMRNLIVAISTTLETLAAELTLCFVSIIFQVIFVGVFMPLDTTMSNLVQVCAGACRRVGSLCNPIELSSSVCRCVLAR